MKHPLPVLYLFFFLFINNISRSQDFQWALKIDEDHSSSNTRSIITDSQGNIYSTGQFGGRIDFDPGPNEFFLTSTANASNCFILKLNKKGEFLWAKHIASEWVDGGRSIILDKNENVIITGLATGQVIDLDPDPTKQFLIRNSTTSTTGSYIVKLSPNGDFIFGNFYLGAYADESTIDNDGNIITTGVYGGIDTDFDAGTAVYKLGTSTNDIFVLKNNNDGNFLWAKKWGGSGYDYPISLTCDNLNNIILTGKYEYNFLFANSNYSGIQNMNFIFKISSQGNELWFRQLGKTTSGLGSNADKAVKTDNFNNIYCTSDYSSYDSPMILDFKNTSLSFTSDRVDCLFFKLNENGEYIWHNKIYGDERQETYSMSLDNNNNIYLLTFINGFTYINNECNKIFPNKNTNYSNEYLLLKFNQNGKFINFKNIKNGFYVQSDFENNLILSGYFRDKPDFDPSPISSFFMHTFNGSSYYLKLNPCTSNIPEADNHQYFCLSSNPTINDLKPCIEIINWYDSKTSNTPLDRTLSLEDGKIYYASYFESCPENERLAVKAHLNTSSLPIITNSTFCKKDNPKLSDISILGSNIKWYDNQNNGNILPPSTLLESNTTYYVTQQENGNSCESQRIALIPTLQGDKLLVNSPQTFCVNQNAQLSDIQITGQNIKWYSNLTGGTPVLTTTVLQDKAVYYASQTINGCESERTPVTINIQNTLAPTGNANQPFCTGQNPTISNIEITGTSIKWYDSPNNGTLLSETTNLQNGKTYYASQTENSCESSRFGVTVSLVNTPSVPSGNPEQSFCKQENKTLNDIQITGQNIKWFDTSFSASVLPNTTLLEDNRTYYASQTIGCDSDRIPILVHVYNTPLPTGNNNQQFCIDEIATIENLNIAGTALKWYDAPINGNILQETDLLQNGKYYVTQTLNNCESERLAITVKMQDTQIPIANSPQQFCIQKSSKISDIKIDGQNIKWYESSSSTSNLSESTSLENGITYYASQTVSTCESDRIPVTISILEASAGDCIRLANEIPYPKFFTPNGDSFNDIWTIDPDYLAPNSSIRIFDRYGKLIKELRLNTSWDGTYLGNLEPASDYWFSATRINGTEYKGHFSLKR
ncbi:T9SS type B sorting domain-containing protein [Flavobacterium sp. LPB0248]|uniref:Ig-like domain-containing protein n=1 Tax=Flavobacterium sp. LPB0248 TaxID=2614441 RepID=UPI0015A63716|nr:T9SS type B sorting domain-containing protein [Flavobacterium sp. LPB0248]QLC67874.1 T9SS type B sorting domain-containing protein [Flavobacterium sp. LPB0248]